MAQKHASNKKGFTLIELMLSVSILIILFSMLTVIFKATQDSFMQASAWQNVVDTSRSIIERMHNEISAAFFDPQGKTSLVGIDAADAKLKTGSRQDEIFFCMPLTSIESADIVEVGYWEREDGNLMRHYDGDVDFDYMTADADDELGLVINDLNFSYFNGETYQDQWDSRSTGAEAGKAPRAVKAFFSVTDEQKNLTKTFETIVHIVSGKRY